MLVNPSLSEEFYLFNNIGELEVATGWKPWYLENIKSPGGAMYHRPEYDPEKVGLGKGRVYPPYQAGQKQFTTYSPHDGGLEQEILTVKGTWYRFSGWVYVWSSGQDNPDISKEPGRYRAMLGANPWADWARADTTIWGEEVVDKYDKWLELQVIFQAWGNKAKLFTRGNPWYGVKHNDSYWGSLKLEVLEMNPTPEPGPVVDIEALRTHLYKMLSLESDMILEIDAAKKLLPPLP